MVPLSLIMRALETAEAESRSTADEARKASGQEPRRVTMLSRRQERSDSPTRAGVPGRTNRCLYLAARASVADRLVGDASAEEDVDCN
jgi:hypothetical protein